jgi:hypothetical protein
MGGHVRGLALLTAVIVAAAGCDEALSDLTGPTENLTPSFTSIQRDILSASDSAGRPACVSCHNGNPFVPGNFGAATAYSALVGARSFQRPALQRVTPGNPEASYLLHKLEGRAGIAGGRMPLNGPYLTEGQIRVVRRWIELGALND